MVRWQRSIRAKPNAVFEAHQWAAELTQWLNNKYPNIQSHVFFERYGTTGTIYFVSDYADAATMDNEYTRVLADEEYRTLVMKGANLFEHLPQDTIMVSL